MLNEIRSVKIIFNRNESIIVALHPLSFPTPGAHRFAYFRTRSPAWLNVSPNFKRGFFRISLQSFWSLVPSSQLFFFLALFSRFVRSTVARLLHCCLLLVGLGTLFYIVSSSFQYKYSKMVAWPSHGL